jgi:hypothetical protein
MYVYCTYSTYILYGTVCPLVLRARLLDGACAPDPPVLTR